MANYATIYFPDNNAAESMAKFAALAESLGYTTTRGAVRGNIRGLLQALVDGEIMVGKAPTCDKCGGNTVMLGTVVYTQCLRCGTPASRTTPNERTQNQ